MSKSLRSFPENMRVRIATRRMSQKVRGLGFWGARDFFDRKKMKYPVQTEPGKAQIINKALGKRKPARDGGK